MKRKDAVNKLKKIMESWDSCLIDTKAADQILERIEKEIGMAPPAITAKQANPEQDSWGVMCSMRCNCEDCNPSFLVHKWEPK